VHPYRLPVAAIALDLAASGGGGGG
jgi:hypothetical protein